MKHYVQYGCGFSAPAGWVNYDASPTLRIEKIPFLGQLYKKNIQRFPTNVRYGDIIAGLPENEDSCDGLYCSHILEHLSYDDFNKALANTYKLLKPGGLFRCVVPDLKSAAENYLESFEQYPNPASEFLKATMLGKRHRDTSLRGLIKYSMGNSEHLWMWDQKSLIFELQQAGFKSCRPCCFNDSADEIFKHVEEAGRFENAVAIECTK
ncbi:MAG: methyltransferase domain-containing protein [Gemmatimonadaceae bacterium]